MIGPVTPQLLEAYSAGELDSTASARIDRHLQSSPADAATVRRLQAIFRTLRLDADKPPRALVESALELHQARRPGILDGLLKGVRATLAALVHDSRATPALAGFRSVQEAVELAYSSDKAEIEMRCEPVVVHGVERWRIVGQVSLRTDVGGSPIVHFVPEDGGSGVVEVVLDAAGVFSTDLPGGRYDIVVRTAENAGILAELEL